MAATSSDDRIGSTPLSFQELERLRVFSNEILRNQLPSLKYFKYRYGFKHLRDSSGVSIASSATCVLSLVATDKWKDHSDKAKTQALLSYLLSRNTSADLPRNNPFTIAWILDAVSDLEGYFDGVTLPKSRIRKKEDVLQSTLKRFGGGVKIKPYPASAYLTQLVVRVLVKRSKLTARLNKSVNDWAWAELARQLALIRSKDKTADAFAVAYLLMLVATVTPTANTSPDQSSIQRAALDTIFSSQRDDGTWPLSRPLFHYPKVGSAYCYEYEMLTQLLQTNELRDLILEHLPHLARAAESASNTVYRVEGDTWAWTSGHHPQKGGPESWATASVYHFFHALDRVTAYAVRKELFRQLEVPLPATGAPWKGKSDFEKGFLDCPLKTRQGNRFVRRSLTNFLWSSFVKQVREEAPNIERGRTFGKKTPRSAIFYGPPGTSKTDLSQRIADCLGWPLLAIDPSHLLRKGMDGIQAEANAIFRMLEQTERVVVLFDEFDELVRERDPSSSEPFSRLLTTAMLPKLARLHKKGTLVFIIATNNVAEFDLAIRRQGRFDLVVQIMPPTAEAKFKKRDWGSEKINIRSTLRRCGIRVTGTIRGKIADLTYGECDDLASDLAGATTKHSAEAILEDHWRGCTLNRELKKDEKGNSWTWRDRCAAEAQEFRG